MINIRKGQAHSLQQSARVGATVASEGVVAGMLVKYDPTANSNAGGIKKVSSATDAGLLGFAVNNQTDGDVIASGKLGLYMLDGASVVESDQIQTSPTVAATVAAIGNFVIPSTTAGKFNIVTSVTTERVIGKVYDVRTLPSVTIPAGYPASVANWENSTVVAIKLNA